MARFYKVGAAWINPDQVIQVIPATQLKPHQLAGNAPLTKGAAIILRDNNIQAFTDLTVEDVHTLLEGGQPT